jgi:catechol 2,3-dioxygenase-like lactoylglutathione lyase family enzyme
MDLAKPTVDVGIFTNKLAEMQEFYGNTLGLPFESVLPVGGGYNQHRYLANGSVIKLMHTADHLPPRHPGGYETIMIASSTAKTSSLQPDPDHNLVEIIPTGQDDVTQLELRVGVTDPDDFASFYTQALGATDIGGNRFKIGDSIIAFFHAPALIKKPTSPPFANALEVIKSMATIGIRYITFRVKDCDAAFAELKRAGAAEALPPFSLGTIARAAFIRDPDGNFIELAQRPAPVA